MSRKRQYNPKSVRAGLLSIFHQKGFAATSLVELEQYSGLNRRQLYNDFGDKKALFILVLNDFIEIQIDNCLSYLEEGQAGLDDISHALNTIVSGHKTLGQCNGCLVCNTAHETVMQDSNVAKLVNDYFKRLQNAFVQAIFRAIRLKELPSSIKPTQLSRYLLGVYVSVNCFAKIGEDAEMLEDIAQQALENIKTSRH